MDNWRETLKKMMQAKGATIEKKALNLEEARSQIKNFLDTVVIPAFEDLQEELKKYGRNAIVERNDGHAALVVLRDDVEEFSYSIRGRCYHRMSFAYPEIGLDDGARICKAEVLLGDQVRFGNKLGVFTRDSIIRDFLNEYPKWMGWSKD